MQYTDEQQNIADDRSNRLLVKALAGTGKTETVALRIQSLVDSGSSQASIQTLCFTTSAVKQLKKRLNSKGLHAVDVRTVHSAARRVLFEWCEEQLVEVPKIISGELVAAKALQALGISPTEQNKDTVLRISTARWNGFYDQVSLGVLTVEEMKAAAQLYSEMKREQNLFDYDDLIAFAGRIVSNEYEEVIVDEAQDLTTIQNRFVNGLTQSRLTYVGDSNQSIFGFAGVDASAFSRLNDWTTHTLTRSFRSTDEVLRVPNQLIEEKLVSGIKAGSVEVSSVSYEDSARFVATNIKKNHSVAVIGRTRFGLDRYAVELENQGFTVARSWDDSENEEADIVVSTVHKAKGNEYDSVFVVDIDSYGFAGQEPNEEEKRLMYVATTRAKKDLKLITVDGGLPWKISI